MKSGLSDLSHAPAIQNMLYWLLSFPDSQSKSGISHNKLTLKVKVTSVLSIYISELT